MTVLCLGATPMAAQTQADAPVYTYVAEYRLKPGKGADFWTYFEKTTQPVLDQLVADGTLLEWGRSASVVHTVDGMSDYLWFCSKTVGGTQKTLEKIMTARPANVVDAVEKHSDRLLQSLIFKTGSKRSSTGYLETSNHFVKPGKGREWFEMFKRFQQPVYEKLLAGGVILGYGIDREYVHTMSGGYRGVWVLLPDADAIDKEAAAFDAEFSGRSPEEGRMMQSAMAEMTVADQHRDGIERVLKYVRK
jgi:hypothetical protein